MYNCLSIALVSQTIWRKDWTEMSQPLLLSHFDFFLGLPCVEWKHFHSCALKQPLPWQSIKISMTTETTEAWDQWDLKMDGHPYPPLCILRNPSENLTINILILCQLSGENHYRGKITEQQCHSAISVCQSSRHHPTVTPSIPILQSRKKGVGHGNLAWSTAWVIRPKL